mmetsp:Transcript_94578/g.182441  ORF Transcript_94578/g.182441 Transcript_94578/m.182441 type:complete len:80 (-) Transcript_94578:129-368(-)
MRDSALAAAVSAALSFGPCRAGRRLLAAALLARSRPSGLEDAMLKLRWREVTCFCTPQQLPFAAQRGSEDPQISRSQVL